MTAACPGAVAAKKRPNFQSFTSLPDSWHDMFLLSWCVWLLPGMAVCIMAKQLQAVLSVQGTLLQKSFSLF